MCERLWIAAQDDGDVAQIAVHPDAIGRGDHEVGRRRAFLLGPVFRVGADVDDLLRIAKVVHDPVALVEQVAADDEVEAVRRGCGRGRRVPVAVQVFHRRQSVQAQVIGKKVLRQRMAVARRHVGAAAVADEAREGQAAADLEDALAGRDRPGGEPRRELRARRPEQAEQRPRRRRDAEPLGGAVAIGVLLAVEQRADDEVVDPGDRDPFLLGQIAGHRGARGVFGRCVD